MNTNTFTHFQYRLALPNNGNATVRVEQKVNGVYQYLTTQQTQTTSGIFELTFAPNQENIRVSVSGMSGFALNNLSLDRDNVDTLVNTYLVSRGYRYGFNGMEKDDEIKGSGNSYTTEFRQYDPRLGRWLTIDPRKDKYPDISPYVAFANNAIIFTDSDGDTIRIFGSKEFKEKTLAALQKLTNDELTLSLDGIVIINQGVDKYKYKVSSKIQGIELTDNVKNAPKQLKKGTELIQDLSSNKKILSIEETNGGNMTRSEGSYGSLLPNGKLNKGEDTKVLWNPNKEKGGVNEDGNRVRPVEIGLGHELIHARNRMLGRRPSGNSSVLDPDGSGKKLSNEELNTRKEENELRKEQGETLRKVE